MNEFESILELLEELKEDSVPKNVKKMIEEIITCLNNNNEKSTKIHKALSIVDDIANDVNLPAEARTDVWNISSALEYMLNA